MMAGPFTLRQILAMTGNCYGHDVEVWETAMTPHERLQEFCFWLNRKYGEGHFGLLEETGVWDKMTDGEKLAYVKLSDDREKQCDALGVTNIHKGKEP